MKAVFLDESFYSADFPFTDHYPTITLPVVNEPFILHNFSVLEKNNINEVAVILNGHLDEDKSISQKIKNYRLNGMQISWFGGNSPRGTAGSLKELGEFIGSSHFLLVCGNKFIGGFDLSKIFTFHLNKKAGITTVVEPNGAGVKQLENIEIDEDGAVKKVHILHHSRDNRRMLKPSGIYVFNPNTLDFVHGMGYMDIREQLIPTLNSENIPVYVYKAEKPTRGIDNLANYFQLNKDLLMNGMNHSKSEIMDRVWIGENVKISPEAYILGPVVIGDNCTIGDHAQIIGPTCIGNEANIEDDVFLRETIIWENVCLRSKSRVEYCVIGDDCIIPGNEVLRNEIVIQDKKCDGYSNFMSLENKGEANAVVNKDGVLTPIFFRALKYKIHFSVKRLFDIVVSVFCLLFFLPIFLVIALVIKLDSSGPLFFCQKRCGKEGKEFNFYKFRTMVKDAEKNQKHLVSSKDIDGPIFKMKNDPRITRVGGFLRKTSLDEFPQLLNVLKGEMSLVGPRPLVMEEMRFAPGWREVRLKVKPGITGIWQINGRSDVSFHDWIKYDTTYVKNLSLKLDLMILIRTPMAVIKGIGAR